MKRAADSSVCIPALLADHEDHPAAQAALVEADLTIAHAAMETYSVLTKLPPPLRVSGVEAAALITARLPEQWIGLDARTQSGVLQRLAREGVTGGATYDGLIALTAAHHGSELLTLDRRASQTYRRLDVSFSLVAG